MRTGEGVPRFGGGCAFASALTPARDQAPSAMDFEGASPAPCAGSRAVEVHGETQAASARRRHPKGRSEAEEARQRLARRRVDVALPKAERLREAAGLPRRWDGASLWPGALPPITLYPVGALERRSIILRAGGREAQDGPDQSNPRGF